MTTGARRRAFSLIELLMVLAVVGLLVAMLVPSLAGARAAAQKASTRARFVQWAAALELFRLEYGYYPAIATDGLIDPAKLAPALLGRSNLAGDPLPADASMAALGGNNRRLTFLAVVPEDLNEERNRLVDLFGNEQIGIRVDVNGDGRIDGSDTGGGYRADWRPVGGAAGRSFSPVDLESRLATEPFLGRIAIYSAGRGESASDLVVSW